MLDPTPLGNQVTIKGHDGEVVESFPLIDFIDDCEQ